MFLTLLQSGKYRFTGFIRAYHPIVHVLLLGTVMARAASSMSMPFLAIYLARESELGPLLIGAIIGLGSLAGTAGGFLGGALSDRFGRKRLLMAALLAWVVVFTGFAAATAPLTFMLLNMLNGLARSLYEPVSQALMADVTDREKRLNVFSLRYLAVNIGVAIGPLAGAYAGAAQAWLPFLLTGILYLVYACALYILLRVFGIDRIEGEQRSGVTIPAAWRVIREDKVLRYYTGASIIGAISYSQMMVTLAQYVGDRLADGAGLFALLMTLNAVTVVALQVPLSRLFQHRTALTAITAGTVFFALGNLGYALSGAWWAFMLSMFLFTVGEILTFPAGNVLIDKLAPEGMRGTYFGAQSFSNIGQFIGPIIGGYLLTAYGGETLFSVMSAVVLSSVVFYGRGYRHFDAAQADRREVAS
ncbi:MULTISPECIES: MDR family MFS transporter [Paenibacillus]|uniref:MDR family MFS transporter n=1 Tax=Paenibacillus TaxID=44249 RepID=UPI0022B86D6F|nr:MFS transporter [Paenibacillus caseinilyticus]MCZ8522828.1 MFS transporter [Paenibacillus caseinilyticus]